jgi:hypothetical protein
LLFCNFCGCQASNNSDTKGKNPLGFKPRPYVAKVNAPRRHGRIILKNQPPVVAENLAPFWSWAVILSASCANLNVTSKHDKIGISACQIADYIQIKSCIAQDQNKLKLSLSKSM